MIDRVGIGTDLHRLEPGGPLRLGGVDVPFDKRAAGHSDADVVLHAVIDALLGAAGLPDIGVRFPDDDPKWRGADSGQMLAEVVAELGSRDFAIVNVDVVIHAERPKLGAHKEAIRASLAGLLGVSPDCVGVKAKTNEGVDAVGQGQAVGCTTVVGLKKSPR